MDNPQRFQFVKAASRNAAKCWFCSKKTMYTLIDNKDLSEVFCCSGCALRVGKIKRLKTFLGKYPIHKEKSKISIIPRVKKQQLAMLEVGVGV